MKKTLTTSIAAIAVAGMIGGGTFADWSSTSDPFANEAGAGILQLSVAKGAPTASVSFDNLLLAPGEGKDVNYHLASSDGDSVPDATLSLIYSDGIGTEDGCKGDEKADELANGETPCDSQAAPFEGGQFAENVNLNIRAYKKGASEAACSTAIHGASSPYTTVWSGKLSGMLGQTLTIPSSTIRVEPGDEICVRSALDLPSKADNSMQGDSHSFDVTFRLDQI